MSQPPAGPAAEPVLVVGNFVSRWLGNPTACEGLADRLAGAGRRVLTASARRARLPRLLEMVATAWMERRRYRVAQVGVYSGAAFLWAEAVCWTLRRARKPYVLTLHGGGLPAFARRWPRRVRRLLAGAAAVTVPSRFLLDQMRPYRETLRLLPNALELRNYTFRLRRRPQPRLIWIRAFHRIYQPWLAPDVLARLAAEFPDARLTMIGPDKGDGSLERTRQAAADLGVADRIRLVGGVQKGDIPRWLDRADIFLNTAGVDNTPVTILEAMASGLCIVSTAVGGIPYLIEDGCDGLLVSADVPEAQVEAARRILSVPGQAETLSRNARRKACRFDWSVVLPEWEELLDSLVRDSRP